jgi:PKD repeat protein
MKSLLLACCVVMLILWTGCKKDDENNEVKAAFEWELQEVPGEVVFTNNSENAISFEWNFDDGTSSTVQSPIKVYNQNGEYIVTLKAFGAEAVNSVMDTVIVNNIP